MSDDPLPACHETVLDADWQEARPRDLDTRDPCSNCFPNTDDAHEIDEPLENLVITPGESDTIHVDARHGDPDYQIERDQSDVALRLKDEDFGPEELGLSPLDGGEV